MQYLAILALAAAAFAAPLEERQVAPLCTSGSAQCCATDILGLAVLNCATPPTTPTNTDDFISICSAEGQQAKCCLLPILGQALICSDVNPTAPATSAAAAAA